MPPRSRIARYTCRRSSGLGNIADCEPPHRGRVGRAREQQRLARSAVAAAATDHLHVALERVGVVEEAHEAHIRLVDSHPEGRRRDDPADPAADEVVLNPGALIGLEARVVVLEPQAVATERPRDALAGVARAGVDDDASILDRPQSLDEDAQAILVATDLLDVVAQVRPHDARPHDGELTAESGRDLRGSGGSRRRGHPEHRRVAQRLERAPDEEVVRPEVVSPHADAVHLVDHDEADADRPQRLDERGVAEPLGCGVEDSRPALGDVADASRRHLLIERRVDERRRGGDLGWQLVDLVLHQGDERREDEGRLRPQHRGELVRE